MAADLRSDLLGAQTDVSAADRRWLSPLPLWTGILAGPIAWAIDLTASYAAVKPVCREGSEVVLQVITLGCLAIVAGGAALAWTAWRHTPDDGPTDGGRPRQRARFMAMLGLSSSALFAMQIVAGAIPQGMIDACR
jgi:hypothetical protein